MTSKHPYDLATILPVTVFHKLECDAVGKLRVFVFTDCMYIVADQQYVNGVLDFISTYQLQLMNSAITTSNLGSRIEDDYLPMLRGGIAFGEMFLANNDSVDAQIQNLSFLGKAMLEAYRCDSKYCEPVIMLTPGMQEILGSNNKFVRLFTVHPKDRKGDKEKESVWGFDWKKYLECTRNNCSGDNMEDFVNKVEQVIANALQISTRDDVRNKYHFMQRYLEL